MTNNYSLQIVDRGIIKLDQSTSTKIIAFQLENGRRLYKKSSSNTEYFRVIGFDTGKTLKGK